MVAFSLSLLLFALALGSPRSLPAQATTVTLRGTVTASDGSVPGGAQVDVRHRDAGTTWNIRADSTGAYRVPGLAPGIYDISVRALGYRQVRTGGVRIVLGQPAVLDVELEPGPVELEPVVITARRPTDVQRIDVSTAVLQEEIERLPLNTRNVLNLAAVAPGIRTFATEAGRSVPGVGALPAGQPRFTNFYLDGVEWKTMYVGQPAGVPSGGSLIPQESAREFRVYVNSYDPEYTRGGAYIVSAVTHRGGNTMKGSIFTFLQNRPLVQRGFY